MVLLLTTYIYKLYRNHPPLQLHTPPVVIEWLLALNMCGIQLSEEMGSVVGMQVFQHFLCVVSPTSENMMQPTLCLFQSHTTLFEITEISVALYAFQRVTAYLRTYIMYVYHTIKMKGCYKL